MSLHRRVPPSPGYTAMLEPGDGLELLGFGLLRLNPGDRYETLSAQYETALVILGGRCSATAGGHSWAEVGAREDVFAGPAASLYVPAGVTWSVTAITALEVAVIRAPAEATGTDPVLIRPDEVVVHRRGRPGFAREVHDLIADNVPAERLVIGETFNAPGEWSSYPPHKHDVDRGELESVMEEFYYFRVDPRQGFGVQMIYTADGELDEAYRIQDGDLTLLPRGYHPVAAAPGYRVYYLWALAGYQGRKLRPADDPAHAWVNEAP